MSIGILTAAAPSLFPAPAQAQLFSDASPVNRAETREIGRLWDGPSVRGNFVVGEVPQLSVTPLGPHFTPPRLVGVEFPPQPRESSDATAQNPAHNAAQRAQRLRTAVGRPRQTLWFWGSGVVSGEVAGWSPERVEVRFWNGPQRSIPVEALAGWSESDDQGLTHYLDFSQPPADWQAESSKWSLAEDPAPEPDDPKNQAGRVGPTSGQWGWKSDPPIRKGQVAFRFCDGLMADPPNVGGVARLQLHFGPNTLHVVLAGEERLTVQADPAWGAAAQPLARKPAWRMCQASFDAEGWKVEIDDQLLAHGPRTPHPFHGLGFSFTAAPNAADRTRATGLLIDDLRVRTAAARGPAPREAQGLDMVQTVAGDLLFGRLLEADAEKLVLEGPFGRTTLPRSQTLCVKLWPRPAKPAEPLSGQWITIEARPLSEASRRAEDRGKTPDVLDRLTGVFLAWHGDSLEMRHPRLGRLSAPASYLHAVRFEGRAWRWELDARLHHVGGVVRPDFEIVEPGGLEWRLAVDPSAVTVPAGPLFVTLDAEGLEGADSPDADQIAAGRMRTSLWLDDHPLSPSLNALVQSPRQTVRIPLPASLLTSAPPPRTLSLRQSPSASSPREFDDWLLHSVRWEVDLPP